jgi:hypothetical protein
MAYRHGSRCHCQWCRGWNQAKRQWAAANAGASSTTHDGHDVWPLVSKPGTTWCRTCQQHFTPTQTGEQK